MKTLVFYFFIDYKFPQSCYFDGGELGDSEQAKQIFVSSSIKYFLSLSNIVAEISLPKPRDRNDKLKVTN
ncbi:hypothetical protein BKM63_19855 [Flavobacterium johnsoniae]|uniref:Uncharacterized protein n=1 Tax=Flavobacterium johnsoniae TaxID=986 RepID=A0A1J7C3D2_FLAJO|nr:hypothetical protein BKM63_19855 [Flavobacterium johnsoniae]